MNALGDEVKKLMVSHKGWMQIVSIIVPNDKNKRSKRPIAASSIDQQTLRLIDLKT